MQEGHEVLQNDAFEDSVVGNQQVVSFGENEVLGGGFAKIVVLGVDDDPILGLEIQFVK